jgi:hypothetical protein
MALSPAAVLIGVTHEGDNPWHSPAEILKLRQLGEWSGITSANGRSQFELHQPVF